MRWQLTAIVVGEGAGALARDGAGLRRGDPRCVRVSRAVLTIVGDIENRARKCVLIIWVPQSMPTDGINQYICVHPSRVVRARALAVRLRRIGAGRAAEPGSACAGV